MISQLRIIIAGAAVVALIAFGWKCYRWGYEAADTAHKEALAAEIQAGLRLDAERRAAAAERDELARQLEEAGNADPIIVDRCLSPNRVRRLNGLN